MPDSLTQPTINVYRACLHPDGLAPITVNFAAWATTLLGQLRRSLLLTADPSLDALLSEVCDYPNVAPLLDRPPLTDAEPELLVPVVLEPTPGQRLSMFTTLTSFGTPGDITLQELAVELFYPADEATEQAFGRR